jgi:GT2 family glycosyltransferase
MSLVGNGDAVPVTAIVTAYQRVEQTVATLHKIRSCRPRPAEILVHVDGGQSDCTQAIRRAFPSVVILHSDENLGPGGSRNKLIAAARNELVASFDDDSYPLDTDYFGRLIEMFERFPNASVVCARLFHLGEALQPALDNAKWIADFSGGGSAYRREVFVGTEGYVPLSVAYGMEEVDLAIRLHARGERVLYTDWLRIYHDTDLGRHADVQVTAMSIANIALLAYLRYPPAMWPVAVAQLFNRVQWLWRHGRRHGIVQGLISIPSHLWRHRPHRRRVSIRSLKSYLRLRRHPLPA